MTDTSKALELADYITPTAENVPCIKDLNDAADELRRQHAEIAELKAELERIRALQPVAWYAPALDGWSVSYFDGKPVIMVGRVGNAIHTRPLFDLTPKD